MVEIGEMTRTAQGILVLDLDIAASLQPACQPWRPQGDPDIHEAAAVSVASRCCHLCSLMAWRRFTIYRGLGLEDTVTTWSCRLRGEAGIAIRARSLCSRRVESSSQK